MKLPKFKPPGAAVPMSKLKGKNVWIMTSTLAVPFVADIAHGAQAGAKAAGDAADRASRAAADASGEEIASLPLPEAVRGALVKADEQEMFAGPSMVILLSSKKPISLPSFC